MRLDRQGSPDQSLPYLQLGPDSAVIILGPVSLGRRRSRDWISPWPDLSDPEQEEPPPASQPGSMRWLIN